MPKPARSLREPALSASRAMRKDRPALVPLAGSSAARISSARMAARHRRSERNVLAVCAACVLIVCTLTVLTIFKEQARDRLDPAVAPLQPAHP
jgi:hypothetical protein